MDRPDMIGGQAVSHHEHPHQTQCSHGEPARPPYRRLEGDAIMLWTIFIILLVLWALGFGVAGQALGSLVHILLIVAVIVLVLQLVQGRRV